MTVEIEVKEQKGFDNSAIKLIDMNNNTLIISNESAIDFFNNAPHNLYTRKKEAIINYKNKLKEEAREYYDWASINEDEKQRSIELALYEKLNKIADDIENLFYLTI